MSATPSVTRREGLSRSLAEMALAEALAKRADRGGYKPRGASAQLQNLTNAEIVISGPAGTGKSRACLQKLWRFAQEYAGYRGLILRKTRASLTETGLVTFERDVLGLQHPLIVNGPSRQFRQSYRLDNGSSIVVAGMDKPGRVLSGEYDGIFIQQAEELAENDWETLISRNRGVAAPYRQLLGDCNPDAPSHWLKLRADRGQIVLLESRHEDNPLLWDGQNWTAYGQEYIGKLDRLTGVRRERLRFGRWVQAEGAVYEGFDAALHIIDQRPIPADWRRFRVVDFGYTNPFVCQWWALDGDDRMYRYREIYMSRRLVSDHAAQIVKLSGNELIETTVCDWDAEGMATLRDCGIDVTPAVKEIITGIQAVEARLRKADDGKPRIFFLRDALVEQDADMVDAKKPLCTEQEFDGYVWANKATKEVPVKENDHGMDAMRYAVMYVDGGPGVETFENPFYR